MYMVSLSLLLYVYLAIIALYFIFVIINVYHLALSAALTPVSLLVTVVVLALGVLTIYGTWYLLQGVDWQQPLTDFQFQFFR